MRNSAGRYKPYRARLTRRAQTLRGDQSSAERKLWYLYLCGLPEKFTRQKPLGPYIVDFYCSSQRLVIEVDGDTHFTPAAQRYDAARSEALRQLGLRIVRFTNLEVMQQFEGVCREIQRALARPEK